jgi:hypothetical protein
MSLYQKPALTLAWARVTGSYLAPMVARDFLGHVFLKT